MTAEHLAFTMVRCDLSSGSNSSKSWSLRVPSAGPKPVLRLWTTLRFLANDFSHERGWFYHFVNPATGRREWKSEVSSIDTALLLAGVLTVRQYFAEDAEIVRLATRIYERVDFQWMLDDDPLLLSHGWKPESGFIQHRWTRFADVYT